MRLGGVDLLEDGPLGQGQFGLATRVSVVEAIEGGTAGQGLVVVGRDADQSLEQRIVTQRLGVVAIGIASEDLVDVLGEQALTRMADERLGTGIGQPLGDAGEHAQFPIEQP